MAQFSQQDRWYFAARATLSAVLLAVCLFVVLRGGYPDPTVKWAIGIIGVVIGYWLR